MPAALIVASAASADDSRETLRLQDICGILTASGWEVDLLVPRRSELLSVTLPPEVRVAAVPHWGLASAPPRRPSVRRLVTGIFMFLRGTALVSRRAYTLVHALNGGGAIVRAIDRATLRHFVYVADYTSPCGVRGLYRGVRAWVARHLEQGAMRHAAAVVFADESSYLLLEKRPPAARVSIIPDPHAEISPDAFTRAEFADALAKVYSYATRTD